MFSFHVNQINYQSKFSNFLGMTYFNLDIGMQIVQMIFAFLNISMQQQLELKRNIQKIKNGSAFHVVHADHNHQQQSCLLCRLILLLS